MPATLYPVHLANGLAPMFLFVFVAGWTGIRGPTSRLARVVGVIVLAGTAWLVYDRKVLTSALDAPTVFVHDFVGVFEGSPAKNIIASESWPA